MENKSALKKEIGKRLKTIRLAKKLTQEQLSEKIGLETRSYANIESGTRLFSVETLIKLMEELDVSADYILKGHISGNSPINTIVKKMNPENIERLELIAQAFFEATGGGATKPQ